jgi:hypothetical protein
MTKNRTYCVLTLLMVLQGFMCMGVRGQDRQRFTDFVKQAEASGSLRFFYEAPELDTVAVPEGLQGLPVSEQLKAIFANTGWHYALDNEGNVFISAKETDINKLLASDFFTATPSQAADGPQPQAEKSSSPKSRPGMENLLIEIGSKDNRSPSGKVTVAGYVRNEKNGEAITGADIMLDDTRVGVSTDRNGYFTIGMPTGRHVLHVTSIGNQATKREIMAWNDGKLEIDMKDDIPSLKTVVVVAEKNSNTRRLQMGVEQLNIKTIKQVPVLMGEPDVLRVLMTLPGVTSVGEGSTGFNVRGGSADQNLILLNNSTIYNPSHLFGFFSAFNPDVVKDVELYKASIPEKYGGRLSSVLEVNSRDGNSKKWTGSGGIGLLTSKLSLEGPIVKDKTSMIIGGRTSYSNWLLTQIPDPVYQNSRASFYDLDLHIHHRFNAKNTLDLSGYLSNDKFRFSNDTTYGYGNRNASLQWRHLFSNKFTLTAAGGMDYYQYSVKGDEGKVNGYELNYDIRQLHFRSDFSYALNNRHSINFGLTTVHYKLNPGTYKPAGAVSQAENTVIAPEQALESALYFGDKFDITDRLSVSAGLRYSMFNYLGPHTVYDYIPGLPKDPSTVADSTIYGKGSVIKTYHAPEVRLSIRYSLGVDASVKLAFNTTRQYMHLLTNTSAISPTDIWKLADPNILPQAGKQLSAGFYKNFRNNTIETSVEVYYKTMDHFLDYKSGAQLVLNPHVETDVINTKGRSYGVELLFRKTTGKLSGWISYTYSRSFLKMDDSTAGQLINGGREYAANFDKPHNLNLIANYKFTHRYSMSGNVVYTTGRPVTLPIAIYNLGGAQRLYYSDRNQYRIPDYFRVDLSFNMEGNHKVKQRFHNSWSFGVYNLTARRNPYSVYFVTENGFIRGYQLSIIGTIVPYITFNFKF